MSRKALAPLAALALLTAVPAQAQAPVAAPIKTGDGKTIGEATFTAAPSGVLVQVKVSGLTPGWHGMHFHAKGDCSDAQLLASGAHINHMDMPHKHGLLNPDGPDMGDLPNIHADAAGNAEAQVFTSLVAWAGPGGLADADGSALVFHANPDDHMAQPIGGAGARVACAVIK